MSISAKAIAKMVEFGLSAQQIADLCETLEAPKERSANAARQQRFREKRRAEQSDESVTRNVTNNVTDDVCDQSNVTRNVTPLRYAVTPPPLSSSPPTPPLITLSPQPPVSSVSSKPRKHPQGGGYSPEFEDFWRSWPKDRRARSNKPEAWRRWRAAAERWTAGTIQAAAESYLASPDVAKDGFKFCRLAEVFLNGGLEAAIEAVADVAPADEAKAWEGRLRAWHLDGGWNPAWGPEPGKPGYRGPQTDLFMAGGSR